MALFLYIVPHFNRKVCGLYNLIKDFEKKVRFRGEKKKETETVGAAAVDFFFSRVVQLMRKQARQSLFSFSRRPQKFKLFFLKI